MSRNKSKRVKMPEGTHTLHMTDPHQKLIGHNHLGEPIYAHVSAPLVRQDGNVHMSKKERLRLRRQRADALIEELNREPNVVKIEGLPTDDTGYRELGKMLDDAKAKIVEEFGVPQHMLNRIELPVIEKGESNGKS